MPAISIGNITQAAQTDARSATGTYTYTLSSPGDQNYTSRVLVKAYQIYKVTPPVSGAPIIPPPPIVTPIRLPLNYSNITITQINGSLTNINSSQHVINNQTLLINFSLPIPQGRINISIVNKTFPITGIKIRSNSTIPNSSMTIHYSYTSLFCYGTAIRVPFYYVNISTGFNESGKIMNVSYYYSLAQSAIHSKNLNDTQVQRYKCSSRLQGWDPLPTYLLSSNPSIASYVAYSNSFSTYAVAYGRAIIPSVVVSNVTKNVTTLFSENGLPNGTVRNMTYAGVTASAIAPGIISFTTKPGSYELEAYGLEYTKTNATEACTYKYTPSDISPATGILLSAGSSLVVSFSVSVSCVAITGTSLVTQLSESSLNTILILSIVIGGAVLVLIIINVLYLLYFRKINLEILGGKRRKPISKGDNVPRTRRGHQRKTRRKKKKGIVIE